MRSKHIFVQIHFTVHFPADRIFVVLVRMFERVDVSECMSELVTVVHKLGGPGKGGKGGWRGWAGYAFFTVEAG